jgi:Reverse transcriptase (RNA-dependent DNA polymerase)
LISYGFIRSKVDNAIYIKGSGDDLMLFSTYVDDFISVCDLLIEYESLRDHLRKFFRITEIGEVKYILGIEFMRDAYGNIKLCQRQYAKDILRKFGMEGCKPLSTPLNSNESLSKSTEELTVDVPYREVIGSLMYLSVATRPDIAAAVCILSKFCNEPKAVHWDALKHVLRYLAGTLEIGLQYRLHSELSCFGFCDANYGGDEDTGRSTSGYAFVLGGAAIAWSSRLQPTVALSSTEAEYMAACHAAKESVWLRELLGEVGHPTEKVLLYTDNMSCMSLVKNPVFHKRTKHIKIQWHFVRDLVESGELEFHYIHTSEQAADMLTKAASKSVYIVGREMLGLC